MMQLEVLRPDMKIWWWHVRLFGDHGIEAHMVEGNRGNIKVTTPEDVYMFRALLQYKENEQAFGLGITNRIGSNMNIKKQD